MAQRHCCHLDAYLVCVPWSGKQSTQWDNRTCPSWPSLRNNQWGSSHLCLSFRISWSSYPLGSPIKTDIHGTSTMWSNTSGRTSSIIPDTAIPSMGQDTIPPFARNSNEDPHKARKSNASRPLQWKSSMSEFGLGLEDHPRRFFFLFLLAIFAFLPFRPFFTAAPGRHSLNVGHGGHVYQKRSHILIDKIKGTLSFKRVTLFIFHAQ